MRTTVRVICLLGLCLLLALPTLAQDSTTPIIVLNQGGIYAVSPDDGSTQTLVAPPPDEASLRRQSGRVITVFSAEWMSPDGQLLAYRTQGDNVLAQAETVGGLPVEHQLRLLNVRTGDVLPVVLMDDERRAVHITVESVAWSQDGSQLYTLIFRRNRRTQSAIGWALVTHQRGAWDTPAVARQPQEPPFASRRILTTEDGVVLVDSGIQSPRIDVTLVDAAGEVILHQTVDDSLSPDWNPYVNIPMNPLRYERWSLFGLSRQRTGEIAFVVFPDSGEVAMEPGNLFPALVSALTPETSLRVSYNLYNGDNAILILRSAAGDVLDSIDYVRTYAFGISGDNVGSTLALAPDGQTLAWLDGDQVMLWRDGESQPLGVRAEALAWAPPLYVPVEDSNWLRG